ncbi:MAG: hypothetical protein MPN21_23790 [Thermoanaerobaculia bacterium]|nr:hypothetical protein [Thermoanaerobaculia bacterium]
MSILDASTHTCYKETPFDLGRAMKWATMPEKEEIITTSIRGAPNYLIDNLRKLAKRHGSTEWKIHYVILGNAKNWLLASNEWRAWDDLQERLVGIESGVNIAEDDLDRVRRNARMFELQEIDDAMTGRARQRNIRVDDDLCAQLGRIAEQAEVTVNLVVQILTSMVMAEQHGMDHAQTMKKTRDQFFRILDRRTRTVEALLDLWQHN